MTRSYSEEFIEQVRFSNNIIDIISEYIKLEQAGKSYRGLCPFHDERTPSFNVSSEEQLYYCFGCGAGGNIFNFVMEIEGLDFVEAVKFLAERAGLELPAQNLSPKMKQQKMKKKKLLQIHKLTAKFYNYLLTESDIGAAGHRYLQQRGFNQEVIEQFKLGFAPDRWQGLYRFLRNKGYSDQILAESGLVISRKKSSGYYDRFRNRVIFTIFNHRNQVIGFGGRILENCNQPKYLNSPETLLFDKSKNLYGLNSAKKEIKKQEEAIIVEGYTDVITAYQFGIKNVVASLGTALTKKQARLLKRYCQVVYIAYDSDTAGTKATLRGLDILKEVGLTVKVIDLPVDQDPDLFIKKAGKDGFESLKKEAKTLIEFKLDSILQRRIVSNIDDKVEVVNQVVRVLARIKNEVELLEYIKRIAQKLNITEEVLKSELKNYKAKNKRQDRKQKNRNNKNKPALKEKLNTVNLSDYIDAVNGLSVERLLKIIINEPELIEQLQKFLKPTDFIKPEYQNLFAAIFNFYKRQDELDTNDLLAELNGKEEQELLLKLTVGEGIDCDYEGAIADYIKKIKEYRNVMKKKQLESEIKRAESDGNFKQVSSLLKEYQNLLRKEGL
ncbi:DNA primase [Natroniella sulfidigena]|uniref:DNA primase n=1 Tax=Natroniella sulfidigena TaxID=723921 RepID=UPI00200A1F0F|nr:DNA primase [Natroniella sulfidigena]MCK8815947.1 DNA primase [Natroniella sulfidigena]